jgi:hypothetical protein
MRDQTALLNKSGEHVATIGFNEAYGLWQIVVVQSEGMEFFCPTKEVALAARRPGLRHQPSRIAAQYSESILAFDCDFVPVRSENENI